MQNRKIFIIILMIVCIISVISTSACAHVKTVNVILPESESQESEFIESESEEDINYEYISASELLGEMETEITKIQNRETFNGTNTYFGVLLHTNEALYYDFAVLASFNHYCTEIENIYANVQNATLTLLTCAKEDRSYYAEVISGYENEYESKLSEMRSWAIAVDVLKNGIDEIENFDKDGYYTSKFELNEYKKFVRGFLNEFYHGSKQNYTPTEFINEVQTEVNLLKQIMNAKVSVIDEYNYYVCSNHTAKTVKTYKYKSFDYYFNLAYIETNGNGDIVLNGKSYVERTGYSEDELYGVTFNAEYYSEIYKTMKLGGETLTAFNDYKDLYDRYEISEQFKSNMSVDEINAFGEKMRNAYGEVIDLFNTAYDYNDDAWFESNRAIIFIEMDDLRDKANTTIKDFEPKIKIDALYNEYRAKMMDSVRSYEVYDLFREFCKKFYTIAPHLAN